MPTPLPVWGVTRKSQLAVAWLKVPGSLVTNEIALSLTVAGLVGVVASRRKLPVGPLLTCNSVARDLQLLHISQSRLYTPYD